MIHVHVCYKPNLQPQGWRYLVPRLEYDNVNGTKNVINKSWYITILFAQRGKIIVLQGNTTSYVTE